MVTGTPANRKPRLKYTVRQINLPRSITCCAQPNKEVCPFAAATGAILAADFIGCEYNKENSV